MDLVDLNPGPVVTRVREMIFKLRLFDLNAYVWAESFFSKSDKGGLNVMYYILTDEKYSSDEKNWDIFNQTVAEVAFYLAEDLEIKTQGEFRKKINASTPSKAIAILSESIKEVLKKSFPQEEKTEITGGEIFNKATESEEQKPVDWSEIYADFCRFSGMTFDQFYSMTMQQVSVIHSKIYEGRAKEKIELMQFHCSIRGIKKQNWPKMPTKAESKKELSEDEIRKRQEEHEKLFKDNKWPER